MTQPTTADRRATKGTAVREVRTTALEATDVKVLRADGDDTAEPRFTGHAAMFDSRTAIGNPTGWGFFEEIAPGAFDKTLAEGDARFLVDHDSRLLVARVSAGDLTLAQDDVGLAVDAGLDQELTYVRDLTRNLDKRRITGMSFGFFVVRDEWSEIEVDVSDGKGGTRTAVAELRRILEVRLLEVSAVTFPAYDDTDAGLRSMVDDIRTARTTTDTSPKRDGESSAPADATRSENTDPAPADATQGGTQLDTRTERELSARFGLTRS